MHFKINQTDIASFNGIFFFKKGLFAFFCIHFVFNLDYPKKLRQCFVFLEEYLYQHKAKEESYGLQKRCKETLRLSAYRTVFYHIYVFVKF